MTLSKEAAQCNKKCAVTTESKHCCHCHTPLRISLEFSFSQVIALTLVNSCWVRRSPTPTAQGRHDDHGAGCEGGEASHGSADGLAAARHRQVGALLRFVLSSLMTNNSKVTSGDTIVIRDQPRGGPPPEKTISLSGINAPRLGRRTADGKETPDEPFAWEARELLREKLVGQNIVFSVDYTVPSGREFVRMYLPNGEMQFIVSPQHAV